MADQRHLEDLDWEQPSFSLQISSLGRLILKAKPPSPAPNPPTQ